MEARSDSLGFFGTEHGQACRATLPNTDLLHRQECLRYALYLLVTQAGMPVLRSIHKLADGFLAAKTQIVGHAHANPLGK